MEEKDVKLIEEITDMEEKDIKRFNEILEKFGENEENFTKDEILTTQELKELLDLLNKIAGLFPKDKANYYIKDKVKIAIDCRKIITAILYVLRHNSKVVNSQIQVLFVLCLMQEVKLMLKQHSPSHPLFSHDWLFVVYNNISNYYNNFKISLLPKGVKTEKYFYQLLYTCLGNKNTHDLQAQIGDGHKPTDSVFSSFLDTIGNTTAIPIMVSGKSAYSSK